MVIKVLNAVSFVSSLFLERGGVIETNKEKLREHGNIGQKLKGTRKQAPPSPWEILCFAVVRYADSLSDNRHKA